jgi:hypothetical protein
MRTALTLLDSIEIASPCPASWDGMVGDDRSRHCRSCDKTVYDLSSLTAEEATSLIREKEGSLCVRLFRRADGRVLTADCPVGLRARVQQSRWWEDGRGVGWMLALAVCGMIDWLLFFAFFSGGQRTMGEACPTHGPRVELLDVMPDEVEILPSPDEDK